MKISSENLLHAIDSAFKDKKKQEIQMIYVMIFGVIFSISYLFFWDSSLGVFIDKQREISSLSQRVDMDKLYLRVNPVKKLAKLTHDIQNANSKVLILKDNNEYIKHKIETISSLIYDKQAWGKYLHSISVHAKENGIKIIHFSNTFADNRSAFGHILDISLKSSGNYLDTLNFINSLERSNLVVDIHTLSIEARDDLYTDLNISVWGITY